MRNPFTLLFALLFSAGQTWSQRATAVTLSANAYEKYIQENEQKHIQEFMDFVSIPSISSLPDHKEDVHHAAEWLKKKLASIGMTTAEVLPTEGHPVVFAEWNKAAGKPTVLIYGHYDVQPVQEGTWISGPFQPKIQNGRIYGRGASDDKGSVIIPVWAVEAMLQKDGKLPVNVKFLIEGEEEIGSPHLQKFITAHKELLKAEDAYNVDAFQLSDTQPVMTMSYKGSVKLEFLVKTASRDLHSGVYGGKVPNAAAALAEIITSFHTPDEKVAVEGFYDKVAPISAEERNWAAKTPYDEKREMEDVGATVITGEAGYTPQERTWYRPTLEITGMWSGYTAGEGFLNIIPGSAHCRLMCRLVDGQAPDEILLLIKKHIESHLPKGSTISYKEIKGFTKAVKFSTGRAAFHYAFTALAQLYGKEPLLTGTGGTNAALSVLKDELGLPAYSFGFIQDDENFHSVNEFMRVSDLEKGQKGFCLLLQLIGNQQHREN
jgi:acetylornithine deacetylase/succinyl-diaminopimelate desuccinylase-like protein